MEVQKKQATAKGPTDWFTGDVYIDGIVRGKEPSHLNVGAVHFSPLQLREGERPTSSMSIPIMTQIPRLHMRGRPKYNLLTSSLSPVLPIKDQRWEPMR
ncbi:MAG: hypothetical protein HKL82_10980 [Acidimicrobiaceae bacterium]|nr:hypothetical protein [Acidimicrobiaceae bacterium]